MNDKEFDKLVKERLDKFSEDVAQSEELWSSIESMLDSKELAQTTFFTKTKKIIFTISSVAAIIIIALFIKIAPNSTKSHIQVAQSVITQKSISQPKEQPIELQQDVNTVLTKTKILNKQTLQKTNQTDNHVTEPVCVTEVGDILASTESENIVEGKSTEESVDNKEINNSYYAYNNYNGQTKVDDKGRRKFNVKVSSDFASGSNGANVYNKSMLSSGNGMYITTIEQISDTEYALPFAIGTQIRVELNKYLSLGIGVNYSILKSSYEGLINKKIHDVKQTLHYIGIPVNLYANFVKANRVNCYVNVGASLDKGLQAVTKVTSYDSSKRYTNSIKGIEYSLSGGIGVEYKLTNLIGLYLEPNLVYYINSEVANSIRTAQPLQFKTELGLRFNL